MYACRTETRISNAVRKTNMKNGSTKSGLSAAVLAVMRASVRMAKVTSRRWPASMLAKSRMARENGRTMNVETNSMGATRKYSANGTPGGKHDVLRYLKNPWCLMPTAL